MLTGYVDTLYTHMKANRLGRPGRVSFCTSMLVEEYWQVNKTARFFNPVSTLRSSRNIGAIERSPPNKQTP